jgi:hypothetical protein
MSPSQVNQDPVQGEFFTAAADLPDRLVRESIQNSLDARRPGETVKVRFAFSGAERALPVEKARQYLIGLRSHIQAVADGPADSAEAAAMRSALECLDQPMTYLTVGDSGTTGLLVEVDANREREVGNDFWGFFRSVGISPKGEDSGGSWGLGKWVFPDASSINAYLGVTRRDAEDRDLLMGMAMLKTHHLSGDNKFPPYGYFAAASDSDDDEWLPLPVDSGGTPNGLVAQAIRDFSLDRRLEGSGLSVVVPYPRESAEGDDEAALTPATIARAVVIQYFIPIVRGHLEVEIVKPGERPREIDSETIEVELGHIAPPRRDDNSLPALRGAIQLARWADRLRDEEHIELPAPHRSDALDDLDLPSLRESYDQSERLAFRLTLNARRRDPDTTTPVSFRLYLERDDDLPRGHDYFVRGHLRIPGMDHIGSHKARALVLVDGDSELGHLLRDAEGPAHATWDPQAQRLKDRWIGGYDRVQRVRRAALLILQRLVERPEERQFDALADLFPSDLDAARGRSRRQRSGTEKPDPPGPGPTIPQAPPPVRLSDIEGGFSFRASPGTAPAGSTWDLRFAYDVVRGGKGRAFRQFEQGANQGAPDFSLHNGLAVESDGCQLEFTGDNAMRVEVLSDDFRLTVAGLDERDVVVEAVEARAIKSGDDTDAETTA